LIMSRTLGRILSMWQRIVANQPSRLGGILGAFVLVSFLGLSPDSQRAKAPEGDSAEMKQIYSADQADREINIAAMTPDQRLDWTRKAGPRDSQRRKQVIDLLSRGALHTGSDFEEAALVFQHGATSDDFLLAHTLATVAIAKGSSQSRWTAAATL